MRSFLVLLLAIIATVSAFSPPASSTTSNHRVVRRSASTSLSLLQMGFGAPDPNQKKMTRENEPEDYFKTNTDKMTDEEKLPIAIAGLVGISLPFIAGLIALYASK